MRVGRGSVYKRKDSPFWWIKYSRAGRVYRESTGETAKGKANAKLAKRLATIAGGGIVDTSAERLTWEQAAADIMNDYTNNARKSADGVERRLRKHLTPFFGGARMVAITTSDIRRYVAKRKTDQIVVRAARRERRDGAWVDIEAVIRPVSNAEINRELAIVKRMFTLAVKGHGLPHRPVVEMLKEAAPRAGFFERPQFEAVLSQLPASVRPVVELSYLTGWRVKSEVLSLQWRQVDFSAGEIRLDPGSTKSGAGRTFPMTVEIRALLAGLYAATTNEQRLKCPNIFLKHNGKPRKCIRGAWNAARRKAGLPGKLLHDFRRTAARNFERASVPRTAAMALIGHKTEAMYRRYAVQDSESLREATARLNRAAGHVEGTPGTGTRHNA